MRVAHGAVLAAWMLLGAGAVLAVDEYRRFAHKDWNLACDNTRTCRAVGYQAEELNKLPCPSGSYCVSISPVSLRITRTAGPNTPVSMTLKIDSNSVSDKAKSNALSISYRLQVGTVDLRGLKMDSNWQIEFTLAQARAVMTEMLKPKVNEALVWFGDDASGDPDGRLSLAGLNAVLLKMDEWQGRVGTPGALVRRGSKLESSVLPPMPMPVVKVTAPVATRATDANLIEHIVPLLDGSSLPRGCGSGEYLSARKFNVTRLTDRRVLLTTMCSGRGGSDLPVNWIANDEPPYASQAIEMYGYFDAETMSITGSGYYYSNLSTPCGAEKTWHFNGKEFVLTSSSSNSYPCRDFGGLFLPDYVAHVIPANSALPPKP